MQIPVQPLQPHTLRDGWWGCALTEAETRTADARTPEWVVFVETALAGAPEIGGPAPSAPSGDERELIHPLRPFLDVARRDLHGRLAGSTADADLSALWKDVRESLTGHLVRVASRTLVGRLHEMRDTGLLAGGTGRERFTDFLRQVSTRAELSALLADHPVLARLLAETSLHVTAAVAELLGRLGADRERLASELLGADPGPLAGLRLGQGDGHQGGRSVTVLEFAGGAKLVYKPRALGLHARWNELLDWFSRVRPDLALRQVRLLEGDGYGWAEFVTPRPCASEREVESFYWRQGALLALLYALDATDMHCENVIASGDQPVVVDVETLFHPGWTPRTDGGHDPALATLNDSVMRIALLPRMLLGEHGSLDVSGIGGERDAAYPTERAVWADAGTDTMRLVRDRKNFAGGTNRPELGGAPADPLSYRENLLGGFRAGYAAIAAHAGELTAEGGLLETFAAEDIRLVMRNTATYAALLTDATEPELLVDAAARWHAFDSLHDETGHEHLRALPRHETVELYSGDVPIFLGSAGGRDVRTGTGTLLPGLLRDSGVDAAARKIRRMGAMDLRDQEWLVQATLATRVTPEPHVGTATLPGAVVSVVPDRQHLLALASGIGDDLVAGSRHDGERANWLGLEMVDGRQWSVLPMGAGLAEGYAGTALFLAQLGNLTGTSRYLEVAAAAVRRLPTLLGLLAEHPELARQVGSGGFFGLGGICYVTARLAVLLDDSALLAALPTGLAAIAAADSPTATGVGEGTAGALAAVSAVYADTGSPEAADLTVSLSERLAVRPRLTAPGFLWGSAGVAWATGNFGAPDGTAEAVETWSGPAADLGWCSGRAGALLARCATGKAGPSATASVTVFADEFSHRRPLRDLSLCHGQLGAAETLVELARENESAATAVTRVSARLLGAIEQYGLTCGTPHAVRSPGLLTGTAGIGFGLLRLGFADQVPSVLLLQPEKGRRLRNPDTAQQGDREPCTRTTPLSTPPPSTTPPPPSRTSRPVRTAAPEPAPRSSPA